MKAGYWAASSATVLLLAAVLESILTGSMSLHMLLHIPLILLSGVLAAVALVAGGIGRAGRFLRLRELYAKYNEYGIPGLLLCTFVAAYWMIPRSLDQVLVSAPANGIKYLGLFIAGTALCDSLP
jgi:hypothetical protein